MLAHGGRSRRQRTPRHHSGKPRSPRPHVRRVPSPALLVVVVMVVRREPLGPLHPMAGIIVESESEGGTGKVGVWQARWEWGRPGSVWFVPSSCCSSSSSIPPLRSS